MFKYRIEFFDKNRFTEYQEGSYTPSASFSDIATKVTISPSKLSSPSGFTLQTPVTAKLTFIGDVFNKSEEVSTCASFLLDKVVRGTEYVVEKEWDETLSPTQYPEARMLEAYHPYLQRAGNNEVIIGSNSGFLDQVVVIYSTPIVGSTEVQTETKVFTGLITVSSINYDVDDEIISFSCTDFLGILKKIESFGVNMLPAGLFPLSGKFILKGEVEDSTGVKHTFDGEKAWRNDEFDMDTIDGERLAVTVPIVYEETPGGTEIPLTVEVEELNKFALQDTEDWGTGRVPLAGTYDNREMLRKTVRFISAYMGRGFTLESNLDTVDDYKETTPIRANYELARGAGVSERFSRRRFAPSGNEIDLSPSSFMDDSFDTSDAGYSHRLNGRVSGYLTTVAEPDSELLIGDAEYWVDACALTGIDVSHEGHPQHITDILCHKHFTASRVTEDGTIAVGIELIPREESLIIMGGTMTSFLSGKAKSASNMIAIKDMLESNFVAKSFGYRNIASSFYEINSGLLSVDRNTGGYIPAEDPELESTDTDTYMLLMRDGNTFIKTLQYNREVIKLGDSLNLILKVNNLSLAINANGKLLYLNRIVDNEDAIWLYEQNVIDLKKKRIIAPDKTTSGFGILNMAKKNQQDIADDIQKYNRELTRESNTDYSFILFDDEDSSYPLSLGVNINILGEASTVYQLEQISKHVKKLTSWKKTPEVIRDRDFLEDLTLLSPDSTVDEFMQFEVDLPDEDLNYATPCKIQSIHLFRYEHPADSVPIILYFRTNITESIKIEVLWWDYSSSTWKPRVADERAWTPTIESQYRCQFNLDIIPSPTGVPQTQEYLGSTVMFRVTAPSPDGDIVQYSPAFKTSHTGPTDAWIKMEDWVYVN